MKILFLSRWYPDPADNGSKIRVRNLIRGLCQDHEVTLISFFHPEDNFCTNNFPVPAPQDIHICPYREFNPRSGTAILGYLSPQPRSLVDTYQEDMATLIRRVVEGAHFDLVIASQLSMAAYHRCFKGIPAIFEELELGMYRPSSGNLKIDRSTILQELSWQKHRRFITRLLRNFVACTVVSEAERKLLYEVAPDYHAVQVIPNSVDVDLCSSGSSERIAESLIFCGSRRYHPNHDAIAWFIQEVLPSVRAEMPGVRLTITGEPGPNPLPEAQNLVLTGRISSVQSLVASAAVSLAPIRSGGGTRLKILESFALRTPVVATSKAAEGLDAQNGKHLLVADTPQEFAQAVLQLLRNPEHASLLADNAFHLVKTRYDWQTIFPRFLDLVDQAAS
jgi:glycosyltransferase involved in cell wall biosynthesis